MISSNQSIGLKKNKSTKMYAFTKKEFDYRKVPGYAYDIQEMEDIISYKCSYDSMGIPIIIHESK